jgi:putative transcriptional regulator
MIEQNYQGYLLAAHPKRQESILRRGVMLVIEHDKTGAIGLQINKPYTNDINFQTVMENVGLSSDHDQPLYNGGPDATNRIHVIHSLDWYSPSTVKVTDQIGVSHDVSILAAIANNEGPEYFRACAGYWSWDDGELEQQLNLKKPNTHRWELAPATLETVFECNELDQWHQCIDASTRNQVSVWF